LIPRAVNALPAIGDSTAGKGNAVAGDRSVEIRSLQRTDE
jgi:hypothetical protein